MPFRQQFPVADGVNVVGNAGQNTNPYPIITADGNYPDGGVVWQGGMGTMEVVYGAGTGTTKLQVRSGDGTTWLDVGSAVTFTTSGAAGFTLPNRIVRVNVSGSAGASIKVYLIKITGD